MVKEIFYEDVTFKLLSEKHEGTSQEMIGGKNIPGRRTNLMCGRLECLQIERMVCLVHSRKTEERQKEIGVKEHL